MRKILFIIIFILTGCTVKEYHPNPFCIGDYYNSCQCNYRCGY